MPRFDWASAGSANVGGSVFTIPNGGYVCKIVAAEWGNSRSGNPQLKLTWDIAEGEYADVAANNGWYDSKHCDYISFAPNALRYAAGKLDAISASNPGFDAKAAIDNDAFQAFVGRYVGLVLKVEYGEWQGRQTKKMRVDAYKTVADIHAGKFTTPAEEEPPQQQEQVAHVPSTFGQTVGYQPAPYDGPTPF
jgi:hypothetical protein